MSARKSSQSSKPAWKGMKVKIWGARGSLPSPLSPQAVEARIRQAFNHFFESGYNSKDDLEQFFRELPMAELGGFGGNTPCVEVSYDLDRVIIDAGSGIRPLGYELLKGPCAHGHGEVHLLFTHFHWDHLMGLPFFTPIFIPGNHIHVYAVQPELPEVFKTLFKKPYFPVPLEKLGSEIIYHVLEPRKQVEIEGFKVTPYQLDHPDTCWGYRFERDGKVFSHCVDTECNRVSMEALGPDLPLYQGVDLMLFDAQYTLMETIEKVDWGHAAASLGLDLAMREGIKKVAFMHHDPASSDEKIADAEAQARRYYQNQLKAAQRSNISLHEVDWLFVTEGTTIEVK